MHKGAVPLTIVLRLLCNNRHKTSLSVTKTKSSEILSILSKVTEVNKQKEYLFIHSRRSIIKN